MYVKNIDNRSKQMYNVELLKKYRDLALAQACKADDEQKAEVFMKLAERHEQRIIEKLKQK